MEDGAKVAVRAAEEGTVASKDEQISLLKAVLIQLNDELKKKDERISELESQLLQVLTNQDPGATATQPACPHCCNGQSSAVAADAISSPMTTASHLISSGDRFTPTHTLPPINEGTDDDDPRQVGGASSGGRGNHSNNVTPRRKISASALDCEQQELQASIASLDSTIAELELQAATAEPARLRTMRRERGGMMVELNRKVQQRLKKMRRNSDDVFTRLATEYENCSRAQMCEVVRELDRAQVSYKAYIDQLLAVVLEANSALLEGMPRLQQGGGLGMDLLHMASRGELFEDIQERERNIASLESYASLLAERIMRHAPPLLPTLDPFPDAVGMEQDTAQQQ